MGDIHMGSAEYQFAEIIWENEPIASGELARQAADILNWKKSTSFTVLKRLCDRGIVQNQDGVVTSLLSRDDYLTRHSEQYVQETFGGSLPAFIAAFTRRKQLSDSDIAEIQRMIQQMGRE